MFLYLLMLNCYYNYFIVIASNYVTVLRYT